MSASPLQNRYERAVLGEGALAWVYEYGNLEPLRKEGAVATGLELGVQLRGDWWHAGARTGARVYGPGSVHVISPAETYALSCAATRHERGLQVGFIVYPDEIEGFACSDEDLGFSPRVAVDARLLDLCRAYADAPPPPHQVRDELLRWVRAHVQVVPADPLVVAKRAIDRSYAQPLYLRHLAEIACVSSPVVFSRRFARRFGLTPIAYRIKLRLNEAARLTWARPDLTVADIAATVGFEDASYFHRAFVAEHGLTPAQYGRRHGRSSVTFATSG